SEQSLFGDCGWFTLEEIRPPGPAQTRRALSQRRRPNNRWTQSLRRNEPENNAGAQRYKGTVGQSELTLQQERNAYMHGASSTMTGKLDRRGFLRGMSAFGGALMLPALQEQTKPEKTVIAKTTHGQLRGAVQDGLNIFKGVPYASSPAGENRFKAPPKLKAWSGVRDALMYGPQSMQNPDPAWPKEWKPAVASEDCLFLNVWTPGLQDGKRRPIMFYSHGGGFATGNGGADPFPQNTS